MTGSAPRAKASKRVSSRSRRAILAAAIFHIAVTLTVFGIGRFAFFPQQFDRDGIGYFASDGYLNRKQANLLADTLLHEGVIVWLKQSTELHVTLYSVCFALLRPVVGADILAVEPLSLAYYLATLILTFLLAKEVTGQRTALLAATIVGLWPSFLLHTTQLLRDPLFIAATLALILLLTRWLNRDYSWRRGLITGVGAVAATLVQFLLRLEIQFWLATVAICGAILLAIRMISEHRLLAGNVIGMIMLILLTTLLPRMAAAVYARRAAMMPAEPQTMIIDPSVASRLWGRVAIRRHVSIIRGEPGGSNIDAEVEFHSSQEVIRYLPRAAEIGFFAPFPNMWFASGEHVGLGGRLLAAAETLLLYAIELLALIGLWPRRRQLASWFLVSVAAFGLVGLGLTVINVGTLYRMRYPFWILLVVLATATLGRSLNSSKHPVATANRSG